MSQSDVYNLLVELGGRASTQQIRNLAAQKYPSRSLHAYVTNRLYKLQKWGMVSREVVVVDLPLSKRAGAHSRQKEVLIWVATARESRTVA